MTNGSREPRIAQLCIAEPGVSEPGIGAHTELYLSRTRAVVGRTVVA